MKRPTWEDRESERVMRKEKAVSKLKDAEQWWDEQSYECAVGTEMDAIFRNLSKQAQGEWTRVLDAIRAEALQAAADAAEAEMLETGKWADAELVKKTILAIGKPRFVEGEIIRDKCNGMVGIVKRYHDEDYELVGGGWILGVRAEPVHVEIIDGRAIVREDAE